ncbi:MAG: RrF2 family transcriptional regulator [Oscillospiraceae bacterium]|nr:RrF2 family transcriptional regulator [Oscillospiraceae bacterium]
MMVSTKGRYALRIMIDLAQHYDGGYVSLSDIARRQYVSLKYMEAIVSVLNKAGFVESQRGKDGGYRLKRAPTAYSIGSILKLTEGSLAPISCSEFGSASPGDPVCEQAGSCITFKMWQHLDEIIDGYLERITLADLLAGEV